MSETTAMQAGARPRVLVTTDINNAGGDPDDKQSLAHLFLFLDRIDLVGVVPDYWSGRGVEASLEAVDAYERDHTDPSTALRARGYPDAGSLRRLLQRDPEAARGHLIREAHLSSPENPLYVLIWGGMSTVKDALFADPAIAPNLRVLSIGTYIKTPDDTSRKTPLDRNWNGKGRQEVFDDPRFRDVWWVENDWTYAAMFAGPEPRALLQRIARYGALGAYIHDVVKPEAWAYYFRAGDTPSLLYLIDTGNDRDDPTRGSWAGRFCRPFPETRPNYYTDIDGGIEWDFADPSRTWANADAVYEARKRTLLERRPEMYDDLLRQLARLYPAVTP